MIDNPDFSPVGNNLGKVEAISVLGIPHRCLRADVSYLKEIGDVCTQATPTGDAQNARDMGMRMPKTRGCPYHCDTPFKPASLNWAPLNKYCSKYNKIKTITFLTVRSVVPPGRHASASGVTL